MSLSKYDPNARMPPRSGSQKHRAKSVEKVRPKRRAQKLRIGTINVGTMAGRGRALTELMRRRKVDIMCEQETRWSGNKSKELGDGYKLIYGSGNLDKRNGVGIIVSEKIKSAVVETGCTDDEKDEFWTTLQDKFEKVAEDEKCYRWRLKWSGGRASQIDYLLYRRRNMVEMINCKVIPGDHVTNQHRLVVMDLNIKNKEAKRAVAIAKSRAYDQLYEDLDSKEGQGKVFQLAKTRNKSTKDIVHIKQMKDENGNIIRKEQGNIKRWEEYFSKLLNEENERLIRGDGDASQGAVLEISRIEVQQALKKMKNGKATGPDGIPIEAWKAMGEEGIGVLWMLMGKVMDEENIPTVWKESILILMFKIVKIIEA
ncbi:uncharacterized protein LOC119572509 [Penaeus monodon]|uniref:uncharacterized protein LOC119572509 n=1 Tax=Penaeus monodon TaxID=6687 RepID=UPI0018A75305|nr:uncharacterized protein LOC119572509 [Penaeus monodon]